MLVALNRPADLRIEVRDFDGNLASPSGSVTVSVEDASGSLVASGAATSSSTGIYAYALPIAVTGNLGVYEATATYVLAGVSSSITYGVETVGANLFEVNELREFESALSASADYSAAKIRAARDDATERLEQAAQVAFSPRRIRRRLSGDGTTRLMLPDVKVTEVHSVSVYGDDTGTDLVDDAFDATEVADVEVDGDAGVLVMTSGRWPKGHLNVLVDYTHGYAAVPGPIRRAAMLLAVEALVPSALPPRATAQATDLGDFRISLANPDAGRDTGIPEVDAAIAAWGCRRPRIA